MSSNTHLTEKTSSVYQVNNIMLSLYFSRQEMRLNSYHMHCLRRNIVISGHRTRS